MSRARRKAQAHALSTTAAQRESGVKDTPRVVGTALAEYQLTLVTSLASFTHTKEQQWTSPKPW